MRVILVILFTPLFSLSQCPEGEIEDCNGNCFPAIWIGDGVCDDGVQYPSDFLCEEFGWDGGDCPCLDDCILDCDGNYMPASWIGDGVCDNGIDSPANYMCEEFGWDDGDCGITSCGPGMVNDCNGNCVSTAFIGDGVCNNTEWIDFSCANFQWDGGDCPIQCPDGQFVDCDGNCWPNGLLENLGDWHCNNTFWGLGGNSEINFDCELFDFDEGDCEVWACMDPEALNFYEHATHNDGSCFYGDCPPGAMDCMGNCVPDNWIGMNECVDGLSENPEEHLFNGAYPDVLAQNISVGSPTRGLCVLPDGSALYVATDAGILRVQLDQNGSCLGQTLIPTGGLMYSCSSSIEGDLVFGAAWDQGGVKVVNTSTNSIVTTIPTGTGPLKVRTSFDGQWVAVSNIGSNTVSIIDTETLEVITTLLTGANPRNVAFSHDDSRLYVSNWSSWTMGVYDTSTWELIEEVPVDYWPQAVWALPGGDYVLVANFGFDFSYDHISVIRTSDWQTIARLQTGAGPEDMMSIGSNGEYLYVSNWGMPCCFYTTSDLCCSDEVNKGAVSVIATPDFDQIVPPGTIPNEIPYIQATLTTIPLEGEYSFGMAAHPDGINMYVSNKDSHDVSVIGFEELDEVEVGALPGEDCETAETLISPNFCLDGCTVGYSDNYNEFCPFEFEGAPDRVYRYDAEFTQTVNIDMCTTAYDSKIYIYEGQCGAYNGGMAIYCNDDFCGVNGWRSRLENVTFEEGNTYYIVIDGYGPDSFGNYKICFENECPGDMNGDGVVNAYDLLILLSAFGQQFDTSSVLDFLDVVGQYCD